MKRFWATAAIPAAAMLCLTFAAVPAVKAEAKPQLVGSGPDGAFEFGPRSVERRPGLINPLCGTVGGPAIASSDCDSQAGREWEGIASTDYFTFTPNVYSPPNPDVAVGPDDILTVVNRTIARYPNPNGPTATNGGGTSSVTYNPTGTNYFPPTSRNFLDVWLGEAALNELCPTFPRSNVSCVMDNASVRYDQMQGRFVVLFTVVDTGLVNCIGCAGTPTQQTLPLRRKASWVMIVSRWATGCQGTVSVSGVNIGGSCTPNTTPAVPGLVGNTEFFTTPQPPGPSQGTPNSGGLNTNWLSYYGAPDGTCTNPCPFGNINSISDVRAGLTAPTGSRIIDCNNTAVGDLTRVCYFPSSARLGLDNDNIVIASSVYDDNVPDASRAYTVSVTLGNTAATAWQGTRLRSHKKAAFYTGISSANSGTTMVPGCSQCTPQVQGDFYDLWGDSTTPYTVDQSVTQALPGGGTRTVVGLNYEPEHVRGRSLASYNGNSNLGNAFSAIWGTVDQPHTVSTANPGTIPPQIQMYHRALTYSRLVTGTLSANQGSIPPTVDSPKIVGGIPTLGALQSHIVPAFINPNSVYQRVKLTQPGPNNQLGTPTIYVGDDRPHRVISREGHRYVARVGFLPNLANFPNSTAVGFAWSTVIYDIVQKLSPTGSAFEVYNTSWGNGNFYAPMHDTPANVVQYGSVSPINLQPFLEKLFVGTTFPPLAPTDPRTFSYGLISGQSLSACKGQEPGVNSTTANLAYPGLFDIRCGEDAYDSAQAYRHPVSGAFTPSDFRVTFSTTEAAGGGDSPAGFPAQIVPMGIRGGAATDPNNMGLWLYGAYAKGRLASVPGFGQWGTYIAHYPLTFPIRDPYNNLISGYTDVQPGNPFFTFVQIAKQTEIDPGSRTATGAFGIGNQVIRSEMARWVVRAQMDESAITAYLNSTGGVFCSFADVACPSGATGSTATNTTGTTGDWRYIEIMYRRGYTKGCSDTNDGQRRFCPTRTLTRGEMAVFIIRAKMNSVFPTVTSGAFTTTSCQPAGTQVANVGDQFGLFVGCTAYFGDVPNTHIYYSFIQKIRELRISNGTSLAPAQYSPEQNLTRGELMTFLVRAFFP